MQDTVLRSGWDTLLFALPFIGMLLVAFFRLDEAFAAPKRHPDPAKSATRRPACGVDEDGQPLMSDPDGRPWRAARH
ncbi:MAG TPA: hypothetical protein VHD85_10710 [Terracidiphilus sp.]|nr:hypothetical protein [Terracidiphilus sp.]